MGKNHRLIDLTGQTFANWTVLRRGGTRVIRKERTTATIPLWVCRCSCGTERELIRTVLVRGKSKSCGCLTGKLISDVKRTHGAYGTPTYLCWAGMIQRCTNPSNPAWEYYGGRGINVCPSWLKFEQFLADMGERPKGLELDRIDNDGDYEPSNCRWTTRRTQVHNKRPWGTVRHKRRRVS